MGERQQKRLRAHAEAPSDNMLSLLSLVRRGGVSTAALSQVVQQLKAAPDTEVTKDLLQEANLVRFFAVRHVEDLQLLDGSTFSWEFCEPNRLLSRMVHSSPRLQRLYKVALERCPCSPSKPWDVCVAFDECVPGNVLAPNNARKFMVLSFNFLQLGQESLWHDDTWLTPILVRHNIVRQVDGGWSAMLRKFLNLFLFGDTGIAGSGTPIEIDGVVHVIWARVSNMLADGDGHRMALSWKGAAGIKPCIRHWNLVRLGSGLVEHDSTFVEPDCTDHHRFRKATTAELGDAMDSLVVLESRVQAGLVPKCRLQSLERATGLTTCKQGLLADKRLRSRLDFAGAVTFDWLHSIMQDGLLSVDAALLVSAADSAGVPSTAFRAYMLERWQFPTSNRGKSKLLFKVFDDCRHNSENKLKCSAAELLGLYVLLRHWAETVGARCPSLRLPLASFCATCDVLDIVVQAKEGTLPMLRAAAFLRTALRRHMECHVAAFGKAHVKPKMHWVWDIADHLERDPFVLDCWIVERLHLKCKQVANLIQNTRAFERSVLSGILNIQHQRLQEARAPMLGGKVTQVFENGSMLGDRLQYHGLAVSVNDVVFFGDRAGKVLACLTEGDAGFLIVEGWQPVQRQTAHSTAFMPSGIALVWPAAGVRLCMAWYHDGDKVIALHM